MTKSDLSIADVVRAVTDDLVASRADRVTRGGPPIFEVSELTLDLSFIVTESDSSKAGFDLKILKADTGTAFSSQTIQRITLKLTAVKDASLLTEFGDELPLRPRTSD